MKTNIVPQAEKLQSLHRDSLLLRQIFEEVSALGNPTLRLDIYRLYRRMARGGFSSSYLDITAEFDKLARLGIGKVVERRMPAHSQFIWKYPPLEVLRAAMGAQVFDGPPVLGGKTVVFCPLRAGEAPLKLELPADFNRRDVAALTAFLSQVAKP